MEGPLLSVQNWSRLHRALSIKSTQITLSAVMTRAESRSKEKPQSIACVSLPLLVEGESSWHHPELEVHRLLCFSWRLFPTPTNHNTCFLVCLFVCLFIYLFIYLLIYLLLLSIIRQRRPGYRFIKVHWDMAWVLQCLHSKSRALTSNPSTHCQCPVLLLHWWLEMGPEVAQPYR
jgi:hypothetical protein